MKNLFQDDIIVETAKKVDTYQEFDYDVELTEEEKEILRKSFRSADFDNNKLLTETEISMAINRETKNHIVVRILESMEYVLNTSFYVESNEKQFQSILLPGQATQEWAG